MIRSYLLYVILILISENELIQPPNTKESNQRRNWITLRIRIAQFVRYSYSSLNLDNTTWGIRPTLVYCTSRFCFLVSRFTASYCYWRYIFVFKKRSSVNVYFEFLSRTFSLKWLIYNPRKNSCKLLLVLTAFTLYSIVLFNSSSKISTSFSTNCIVSKFYYVQLFSDLNRGSRMWNALEKFFVVKGRYVFSRLQYII